jgi:hypothetical protein
MSKKKDHFFKPTPAMELYAFQRAKLGKDVTIVEAAAATGVSRETAQRWKNQEGFLEWLDERVTYYKQPILDLLEQVARIKLSEFKYWEAIALKYGYITKEQANNQTDPNSQMAKVYAIEELRELIKVAREAK